MQTVNFTCGHCSNLMAVSQEYLGQQVRCPHCQQVVLAPAANGAAPAPPPEPAPLAPFEVPPTAEPESIFSPPEAATDDVFASAPPPPRLEVPPTEPAPTPIPWPDLELSPPAETVTPVSSLPPGQAMVPVVESEPPSGLPTAAEPAPDAGPVPPASWMEPAPGEPAPDLAAMTVRPRPRKDSGWIIPLFIIPLISYAILATIAVVILYNRLQQQQEKPHPLEMMPDIQGEQPGGKRQSSSSIIDMPRVDEPLPEKLRGTLGQPIRIGDLEITPTKVEKRRVWVLTQGFSNPTESDEDVLVLHLRLRNVSADAVFRPLDPCFDRQWKEKRPDGKPNRGRPPYTYLELAQGGRRFYGGPIPWEPKGVKDRPRPETVFLKDKEGRLSQDFHHKELKPGEETDTFVCTDYKDHIGRALENYAGNLLWRVQVRRGLVRVGERDVSATAVIGVEFSDKDVRKAG